MTSSTTTVDNKNMFAMFQLMMTEFQLMVTDRASLLTASPEMMYDVRHHMIEHTAKVAICTSHFNEAGRFGNMIGQL